MSLLPAAGSFAASNAVMVEDSTTALVCEILRAHGKQMSESALHFIDEANVVYTILVSGLSEKAFLAIAREGRNFEDLALIDEQQAQFRVGGVLYVWDMFAEGDIELSVSSDSITILRNSLLVFMETVRAHAPDCAFIFHFDADYQHEIGRV